MGRNRVFAQALLHHFGDNAKLEDIMKAVTVEVKQVTGGVQKPWLNSSLSGDGVLQFRFSLDSLRKSGISEGLDFSQPIAAKAETWDGTNNNPLSASTKSILVFF